LKPDTWGMDPQVQYIRRLFTGMEKAQRDLLERLGFSLYDDRLGPWRQATLSLFEKVWALSARQGTQMEEKDLVQVYLLCLITILNRSGTDIPAGIVSENKMITNWIKEVGR
jgi:hypothetical protein